MVDCRLKRNKGKASCRVRVRGKRFKRYKVLKLSSKRPLDTQLKGLGHSEGYTGSWNIRGSMKPGRDSLYRGGKKMYEIKDKRKWGRRGLGG